jgi:hypothetical protein
MKYFTREYFCENWTYVKYPIENTIFIKKIVGMANLALKWKDPPNSIANFSDIWRIFPFVGKVCHIYGKF